jgi:fructokinase
VSQSCGIPLTSEEEMCRRLQDRFGLEAVCLTRGEGGAALLWRDDFFEESAPAITVVDTVGAGDAFAAALLHGLCEEWPPEKITRFGNLLGSYVASQRGAIPKMSTEEYLVLTEQ